MQKSEQEIAKALQFNGRKDYLFALQQEWNSYKHLQNQINETDVQIDNLLKGLIKKDDNKKQHVIEKKKSSSEKNKNGLAAADVNLLSYQYFEGMTSWLLKASMKD